MYKLTYKGQFVDGFDTDQVVGNLAQLLNLKPKAVRLAFLSERPSVIKLLDSASEVERWCAAFQEAGVYLDVVGVDSPNAGDIADQIELELELHDLEGDDEEEPDERLYLIRKAPAAVTEPQTFDNQPLATRSLTEYPVADTKSAPTPKQPAAKGMSKVNGATKVNGKASAPKGVNGSPVNGAGHAFAKEPNGSHHPAPGAEPIEVQTKVEGGSKPAVDAPAIGVQSLSVAAIDALAAQESQRQLAPEAVEPPMLSPTAEVAPAASDAPQVDIGSSPQADTQMAFGDAQSAPKPVEPSIQNLEGQDFDVQDVEPQAFDTPYPDAGEADPRDYDELEFDANTQAELEAREFEHEEDDEDLHEAVDFHKSHFVWGMLLILVAILATAGTILWLKRSTWTPVTVAPQEAGVTAALASSSLFGLVHADVDRLLLLSPSTDVFGQLAEPQPGFWRGLSLAGIDLRQQVDDLWLGAYGQNGQSKVLWVLQGTFAVDAWRGWLKKSYTIDGESPDGFIFSSIDENTCEKSPVLSASISNSQIVLGAPELVAAFNGRLQANATADRNLETWAKGYATQMFSAALFQPGQLPEGSAAMALGKLSLPAEPIQGIYLGLEPKTFPPAVEFNAIIDSNNPQFIADAQQKLAAAQAAAKTTLAADWPETLALYERLKLASEGNQLRASIRLDEQAPQQLQTWASSLLSRAFGLDAPPSPVTEERIDSNPPVFTNLASAQLPPFSSVEHFNEAFIAQTSAGPFGIGIRDLEQTDQRVEISMDVNAFNLPNLGQETNSVVLRVTDIVDHQDKSLLPAATGCGTGVKQPAPINLVYQGNANVNGQLVPFTGLQGTKKIQLPEGIALSAVGAVKGSISHQIPLEIERVNVNGPLAGKTLELHGVKLRFLAAGPNRLYFQAEGNTAALLQVNAMNEDGKLLASTSAMRGDSVFGDGKTIAIDYQGQIAAAEVIVASKIERKDYDFSIARLFPPAKSFAVEKSPLDTLGAKNLAELEKDTPPNNVVYPYQSPKQTIAAGPALIALNELTISGQQFSLNADVYTRNNHPVAGQLGAVRLMITEVEDAMGNLHSVDHQSAIAMEHMGGSWVNGKFEPDPARPWLRGVVELRDRPLEQTDAVALWGKLVFRAAEDPISIKVPFQFGMQWNNNDGILKLRRWEAGRLIFDMEGQFPDLMSVNALDDMGVIISQPAELRTQFGKHTIELDVKQIPEMIEFNIARTQNSKEFPVEIRVLQ